jgi:thiamine pyrophosphate-dependent acetolactate synthase large subunit-like protein
MQTVADQFAETLAAGVRRIYGIIGDSLHGLTDSVGSRTRLTLSAGSPRD